MIEEILDNCGSCTHWEELNVESDRGFCKRYPPTIRGTDGLGKYIQTYRNNICGEYPFNKPLEKKKEKKGWL